MADRKINSADSRHSNKADSDKAGSSETGVTEEKKISTGRDNSIKADSAAASGIKTDNAEADSVRADSVEAESMREGSAEAGSVREGSAEADSVREGSAAADSMSSIKENGMDENKILEGVRLLLEGIGEDPSREGLLDTPRRMARMYQEIFGGMSQSPAQPLSKTFHTENTDMVLETDITFYSTCEHHLLPFYGKAHVAYIPDGKVAGLSKLARTVDIFARRPQLQERMTVQVAEALMEHLKPKGAMVMLEAEHMCMTMRGIRQPGSRTVTFAARGVFEGDAQLQERFFQMVRKGR